MADLLIQAAFSGLLVGAYYALIALGLALVFGTMRVINLAHGEFVLLAAYVAYTLESSRAINPVVALPLAIGVVTVISAVVHVLVARIHEDRELNSLILTFGVSIILANYMLMAWSADVHSTNFAWYHAPVDLASSVFSMRGEVLFAAASLALVAGLWLWLGRSWYGRAVRAVAANRDAAGLMGIDPRLAEIVSFMVAGVLASVAGLALYTTRVITPALGQSITIKAFIITVLAGMGSIPGVLVGAVLIGVVENLTVTFFSTALQELGGIVLFIVVLFLSPSGLFGKRSRRG